MYYFGTNLRQSGHYTWDISGEQMVQTGLLPKGVSFNPEQLTINLPKGEVAFYQGGGCTVLAVSGSPIDTRPGCKSVFWVLNKDFPEGLDVVAMSQLVINNTHGREILKAITGGKELIIKLW